MGVGGHRHAPAAVHTGRDPILNVKLLGGPQGRSGRCGNSRPHRDSIPGPSNLTYSVGANGNMTQLIVSCT